MGSGHRLTCIALALVALAPAVEASPPTAWLSWDRESRVTDLNDVPGYRVSLFMRIADPPSGFIALASQLRWTPNDLLGPCYGLWSDSLSGSPDGYWEFEPGGLSLGSDSTFHYSLHPPAGGDLLFKYQFGGGACGARPATVCLDWVKFVTAAGDTVFADVLGGATVLGGDGDCGLFLQQLSPAILGQRAAVSVEIVGGGFSAGMMASLEGNAGARAADSFLVITSSRVHAVFDTRGFSGAARVVLTTPDGASASSSALVEASSSTPAPYDSASLILWTRPGRLLLPSASTGAALPAVSGDLGFAASLALLGVSRVESCSPASILDPELAATLASPAQLDIFILHLADTNVVETCQQLASDTTNVIECHPNWTGLFMEVVPSDAPMPKSWHLRNTGAFPEPGNTRPGWDSRVSRAWSISSGGVPVRVGVLDSGSRTGHPDLVGRYANGPIPPDLGITDATDYLGHGAPVAGIIGATGGAGRAVGVDWSAEIYSFKISNNNHSINEGVVNQALDYARWYACRMVNMSFGAMPPSGTMEEHLYNAFHAGIFLAAASGNYDSYFRSWPAEYHPYVVSVGASLYDGRRWSDGNIGREPSWGYTDSVPSLGSSWGNHLKFLAPGGRFIPTTAGPAGYADPDPARLFLPHHQDVPSTVASGSPYWGFGGTSAATPVVSGAAALIRSIAGDSLGNEEIAHLLSMTARPPFEGPSGYQPQSGWGVVDIEAALGAVRPGMRIERAVAFGGIVTDTAIGPIVDLMDFPGLPAYQLGCKSSAYNIRRTVVFAEPFHTRPLVLKRTRGSVGVLSIPVQIFGSQHASTYFSNPNRQRWEPAFDTLASYPDSCVLRTRVYALYKNGQRYWWPCPPDSVRFAYTLVGIPPSALSADNSETRVEALRLSIAPTPARGTVCMDVTGAAGCQIRLEIFDLHGRRFHCLDAPAVAGGSRRVQLDLEHGERRVEPGLYFVRASSASERVVKRVVVLR